MRCIFNGSNEKIGGPTKAVWAVAGVMFMSGLPALADDREELLAAAENWLAGSEAVLLTYEQTKADGEGAGRRTIGFDPDTGAWFIADHALGASGRTIAGEYFEPRRSSMSIGTGRSDAANGISPASEKPHVSRGIDQYIPIALIVQMRFTSEGLRSVQHLEDGTWEVAYETPTPDPRKMRVNRVWFDGLGVPLRFAADADETTGREAVAYDYEIEADSPAGLAIVTRRPNSPRMLPARLVDVRTIPEGHREVFEPEAVQEIATDNRVQSRLRLGEIAAEANAAASGHPAPYVRSRMSGAGWPLIISGIVVVLIGLIALVRGRAGR